MRWLLVVLLLAFPAEAQVFPSCGTGREGVTACLGGRQCECRWEPGGSLTGRPAGHRWDCGVRRPACWVVPPELPPPPEGPMLPWPLQKPQ